MKNAKELLLDLLKFDTQNSDAKNSLKGETIELLKYVENYLKDDSITTEIQEYSLENYSNRGILLAFPKEMKELPNILLQGHVDTVPAGNFKGNYLGEIKEDTIIGRGAVDMKGSVACIITAFKAITKSTKRKFNPILLLTSDEEAKGFAGIKHFLKNNELKIDFAICGEPSNFKIYNKFKGAISKEIIIHGKSAHGSKPHQGKNAIYDSLEILNSLKEFASHINEKIINHKFESENEHSKKSTLNVGKITGGNKVNSVPESCKIEFEMRLVCPIEDYEKEVKEKILNKIPAEIKYEYKHNFHFNPFIIEENKFIPELEESIKKIKSNAEFGIMMGFSEASIMNEKNIPTIIFGVGNSKYSHSEDEQIETKDLEIYEKILINFFLK
ncbi:M20/M25/M40 family metallo-hydrolase [archaeon]|jgi:acetylornithine deacetylase/succinyl-diaminopimelate desuccinylase-like protein|nr:M20/M25/M40 family metallo-hydrolase [archaeon]